MNGRDLLIIFTLTALTAVLFSNFNSLSVDEGKHIFDSTIDKYLVKNIVSPRLAGIPLKVFGIALNTPFLGTLIAFVLFKTNKLDLVQRFATALPDDHIPYAYPQTSLNSDEYNHHEQLSASSKSLSELYQQLSDRNTATAGTFSFKSAASYTSLYKTGKATPSQIIDKLLQEIGRTNETLRAWNQLHADEVRKQALESTRRYENAAPLGPLDGVPVTVKDEMAMKGYYTSYGTKIFKDISSVDAISVSRLKAAGAIIVGKTTMHELGLGTSGVSLPFGTPRNPYDVSKYPGGSSSGSAVAVSSGYATYCFINSRY